MKAFVLEIMPETSWQDVENEVAALPVEDGCCIFVVGTPTDGSGIRSILFASTESSSVWAVD